MITLDRLRYFVEVATCEHVGRAAAKVHISASVISAAIQHLEEELNCKLFDREKQRIKLNVHGHRLLDRAREILANLDSLPGEVRSDSEDFKGHYKLGASHFLMTTQLIPAVLRLQKSQPQEYPSKFSVELRALDSGHAMNLVASGELDAALIFKSSYSQSMDEIILERGNFEVTLRKSHPIFNLRGKKIIESLNQLPALTFRTTSGANFWENHPAFKDLNLVPQHRFFYEDTQSVLGLLDGTDGWAFLPDRIVKHYPSMRSVKFSTKLKAPVNISIIKSKNLRAYRFVEKLTELLTAR